MFHLQQWIYYCIFICVY